MGVRIAFVNQLLETLGFELGTCFPTFLFLSVDGIEVLLVLIYDELVGGCVQSLTPERVLPNIEGLAVNGLGRTDKQFQILVDPVQVLVEVEGHPVVDLPALHWDLFAAAATNQHIFKFKQFICIKTYKLVH